AIARAQLEAEFLFLRGAVVRIREIGRFVLHVRDGAVDLEHQVALPAEQDGAEMLQLLLAHVLLAALDDVRLYIARTGQQRVADLCVVACVIGAGAGYGRERLVGWHSDGGIPGFMDGAWRRGRFGGCSHRPASRCGLGWFFRGRRLSGCLRATRGNSPGYRWLLRLGGFGRGLLRRHFRLPPILGPSKRTRDYTSQTGAVQG